MDTSFYLKYLLIIVLAVIVWVFFLISYRNKKSDMSDLDNYKGLFLIGPFYLYLRKKGFSLSKREIIGWIIVISLMIIAPLVVVYLRGG